MNPQGIKRFLEGGGLRCTPQRYAVIGFLMACNGHPTAAEIFEAVNRRILALQGLRLITICGTWYRQVWCVKWPSKAAPRDSMRKVSGITTSSAIAVAMLRIWPGTTCQGRLRAPSVSGFFADANLFSAGSARSALHGTLPVRFRGHCARYRDRRLREWKSQ